VRFREPPPANISQAQLAAELERIESTLSHWRPDSATAQFNASETTFATEQPAELVLLVSRALELSRATDGAYDITVAPLVSAWGFGPQGKIEHSPTDDAIQQLLVRTGHEKLHADPKAGTLQKDHPELQIDLGSLLQGYAADKLGELLTAAGVQEYLIDVGGELLARGSWEVAIENPADPKTPLRRLALKDEALATSGLYRATRQVEDQTVHHLIDPKTGHPFTPTAQLAAVIAPTALEADAWATALLAVGLPDALPLADKHHLSLLMLDKERRMHANEGGSLAQPPNKKGSRNP
jgi:thiamine biosynthesis lipoprotein